MRQKHNADGYLRITLWDSEGAKTRLVHRLVAEAFLDDPGNLMTVNHKDGNKLNNNIENLEWMSLADNIRYGMDNGQFSAVMHGCTVTIGEEKMTFRSRAAASRFLGKSSCYICQAMKKGSPMYDSSGRRVFVV